MSCKWELKGCKNEGKDKCLFCTSNGYHFDPVFKQRTKTAKVDNSKRMGSTFEANNHINNHNMINDVSTRMTPNSGAGKVKGDEEIRGIINIMEELKTHQTKNEGRLPGKETFTIKKEWLNKLNREANEAKKEFWYLKFAFKDNDLDHYVVSEAEIIMSMVKTMIEDRRIAKSADAKIESSEKRARMHEAKAIALESEVEYLKAKIKELEGSF